MNPNKSLQLCSLASIHKAYKKMKYIVKRTPLTYSAFLSDKYDAHVYLKREDLQIGRSYNIRGAFNYISSLSEKEQKAGLVLASSGSSALGVA